MSIALSKLPYANLIKKVGITGVAQVVIQFVGVLSGILVIRYLSVEQYALYTIANSMLGTMTVFSDSGISTGLMAMGGRDYKDKKKLGEILTIGLKLRKLYGVYILLAALPTVSFLIWKNSHSVMWTILTPLAIVPAFWAALSFSPYEIVLKLHDKTTELQKIQILVSLVRLVLISTLIYFLPWAIIALTAFGIPQWLANTTMKNRVSMVAELGIVGTKDNHIRRKFIGLTMKRLPEVIFFAISGQITIWMMSAMGYKVETIGQYGALGRVAALFVLVGMMSNILFYPKFAILVPDGKIIKKFLSTSFTLLFLAHILVILICYFAAPWILTSLGKGYLNLNKELLLFVLSTSINLMSGHALWFANVRAWVMNPLFNISFNLASILTGILLFSFSSLENVLYFNIFTSSCQLILNITYLIHKVNNLEKSQIV